MNEHIQKTIRPVNIEELEEDMVVYVQMNVRSFGQHPGLIRMLEGGIYIAIGTVFIEDCKTL